MEKMEVQLTDNELKDLQLNVGNTNKNCKDIINPKINFVISSYYKGTGLEEVLKKLEEYLDNGDQTESDITNI